MRTILSRTMLAAVLAITGFSATACHHHRHEGPAQHAGRKIDNAADKAGDKIEDAGRKVNRALPGD